MWLQGLHRTPHRTLHRPVGAARSARAQATQHRCDSVQYGHGAPFLFGIKRVRASAKLQRRSDPDHRTFGDLEQIPPLSRHITSVGFGNGQHQTRAGMIHLTQLARRESGRSGQALKPPHEFQAQPRGIQLPLGRTPQPGTLGQVAARHSQKRATMDRSPRVICPRTGSAAPDLLRRPALCRTPSICPGRTSLPLGTVRHSAMKCAMKCAMKSNANHVQTPAAARGLAALPTGSAFMRGGIPEWVG